MHILGKPVISLRYVFEVPSFASASLDNAMVNENANEHQQHEEHRIATEQVDSRPQFIASFSEVAQSDRGTVSVRSEYTYLDEF